MTAPTYFTVIGDFKSIVADTVGDTDADPDSVSLLATVTFTPRINDGDLILATNASPRPTAFVAAPISGTVGSDGILKLRDAGSSGFPGLSYTPVRLLADTPLLELDGDLFYDVTFSNVSYNGRFITLNGFTFQAPTSDVTLNLVTVARAPGQPATAITKIAPTGVRFTGGNMVFSFSGVDIPEPLPLASITGPQGPQGPQGIQGQAGVSLDINGTVATYANLPSSAADGEAYVVAADGKLYYRFDGAWPADGQGVPFVGPQGPTGAQGIQGPSGTPGASGVPGEVGATGPVGATGASGASGGTGGTGLAGQSVSLKGSVASYSLLPGSATTGDGYIVLTDNLLYVWNGSWPAEGSGVPFVGPVGATGASGVPGASGASGGTGGTGGTGGVGATGPQGPQGDTGPTGPTGATGASGASGGTGGTGGTGGVGASGAGVSRSIETLTANATLGSAAGTDYVVYANIATIPEVPATGDPNYPSATALLHLNGASGSTTLTDSSTVASNWTATGDAALSTSTKQFGSASLSVTSGSITSTAATSNFAFPGDFTVEFWYYANQPAPSWSATFPSPTIPLVLGPVSIRLAYYRLNSGSEPRERVTMYAQCAGVFVGGGPIALSTGGTEFSPSALFDKWNHIALTRVGSTIRLFINGTQDSTATSSTSISGSEVTIGSTLNGFVDEVRILKGTGAYSSNFSVATTEFADSYTALVPAVAPKVTLPSAVSNTSMYRIRNLNADTLAVGTTSSQTIEGATGATITTGNKALYISDGASGWRSW